MNIKKQNLVFFAPNSTGGVMSYLINLSEKLNQFRVDHKVVFYGELNINWSNESPNIQYIHFDKFDSYKSQLHKLKTHTNKHSIIIANDRAEIDMCKYFAMKNLLVYIMHGDLFHYRNILKEQIIDVRLFVSEHLSKKYFFKVENYNVIFPIVNIPNKEEFQRHKSKKSNLKIAFVGRLEIEKGADEIIILDELLDIDWGFFIPKLNSELNFIKRVRSKKIEFDLPNYQLLSRLKDYDYLFFPSRSEGFGMAVLEAIKLGVVPIVREIEMGIMLSLTNNINSIKYRDVKSLKIVLEDLNLNKDKYQGIVDAGKVLVEEKFDSDRTCEKFLSQINNLEINQSKHFGQFKKDLSFFVPIWIYRILKKTYYKYGNS